MRTVASVFSWLGGLLSNILVFISFFDMMELAPALVLVPIFYLIITLIILFWRESSINSGKKVACGVMTLIFCGAIGGILTLCIPYHQLGKPKKTITYAESTKHVSALDRAYLISQKEKSQDRHPRIVNLTHEANLKAKENLNNDGFSTSEANDKTDNEKRIISLLNDYKSLLDNGAITKEEYEQKKKELLTMKEEWYLWEKY